MKFIIIGKAGAGKTTVAKYLQSTYGVKQYALGDMLKVFVSTLYDALSVTDNVKPIPLDELYNIETKQLHRKRLQLIGTDVCRKVFGNDIWIYCLKQSLPNDWYVIDDVRFINEFEAFSDCVSIRVNRSMIKSNDNHPSEVEMDGIETDYVIENEGTLSDLYSQVDNIINMHCSKPNVKFNSIGMSEEKYCKWLISGKKTVEVRLKGSSLDHLMDGDSFIFRCKDSGETYRFTIISRKYFDTFRECIKYYSHDKLICDTYSDEECLNMYYSFYNKDVTNHPVVAFTLDYTK